MDDELMSSFRWIEESELDLTLDQYHDHLVDMSQAHHDAKPIINAPAARRNRALTSLSIKATPHASMERRKTSEVSRLPQRASLEQRIYRLQQSIVPAVPTLPAPFAQPQAAEATIERGSSLSHAPNKVKKTITQHVRQESAVSVTPPAEHYLNPEARLKLRMYLASPSKFDEALEFGFPSLSTPGPRTSTGSSLPRSSTTRTRSAKADEYQTFLRDRDDATPDPGVFADTKDPYQETWHQQSERKHHTDMRVTTTTRPSSSLYELPSSYPSSPAALSSPGLTESSLSHDFEKALVEMANDHYSAAPAFAGREMTLRMTLTRPDLRADEDALYPHAAYAVAPQVRFIGGRKAPRPATAGGFGAAKTAVAVDEHPARDPLSLDKLFDDEPAVKQGRSGFRKLFSRKR